MELLWAMEKEPLTALEAGTLKRTANKLVDEGRDIPSFQVLLDCLKEKFKDPIKFVHVTTAEINEVLIWYKKKVLPLIGTMKVHQVLWTKKTASTTISVPTIQMVQSSQQYG